MVPITLKKKKRKMRVFHEGLMVKIPGFYCHGWVQSLIREVRSLKPCNAVKKGKKKERKKGRKKNHEGTALPAG